MKIPVAGPLNAKRCKNKQGNRVEKKINNAPLVDYSVGWFHFSSDVAPKLHGLDFNREDPAPVEGKGGRTRAEHKILT